MDKKREQRVVIVAVAVIAVIIVGALAVLILSMVASPRIGRVVTPPGPGSMPTIPPPADAANWQTYTAVESGLSLAFPPDWFVHAGGKALQITPNAQPTWSSFFDPNEPHGGPTFNLAHNLNREMGPTPLAEVENLAASYGAEAEMAPVSPPAPLPDRQDVVVGVYRFTVADDEKVLLVGAAVNPVADAYQPVVALTALVEVDSLETMQPIFTTILRSLRPAGAPPVVPTD